MKVWHAVQGIAATLIIGVLLGFVAVGSHRPAWFAAGTVLLLVLAWQGWRHGSRSVRWVALGMALGPLALMLFVSLAGLMWSPLKDWIVLAACALFGGLSFIALRTRWALASGLLVWYLMLAAPLDIARQPHAGGPLVQPLMMGLLRPPPTPEEAMQFVEGGCIVGGLEPRWVVTWQQPPSTP